MGSCGLCNPKVLIPTANFCQSHHHISFYLLPAVCELKALYQSNILQCARQGYIISHAADINALGDFFEVKAFWPQTLYHPSAVLKQISGLPPFTLTQETLAGAVTIRPYHWFTRSFIFLTPTTFATTRPKCQLPARDTI